MGDHCPDCGTGLGAEMLHCRCGWAAVKPEPKPARNEKPMIRCGNCGNHLTGAWTQSPKGRVCDPCWRGYMRTGWPSKEKASA